MCTATSKDVELLESYVHDGRTLKIQGLMVLVIRTVVNDCDSDAATGDVVQPHPRHIDVRPRATVDLSTANLKYLITLHNRA